MEIKLPKALQKSIKKGFVLSIIQFGSSLQKSKYRDIDLAVLLKRGCYENFLEATYGEKFQGFDISLIKEEEIQGPEKFRFGGHGAHFLTSLIQGKTLYGGNPFLRFKDLKFERRIKKSILSRLFDYIEDVRRNVFIGKINKNIKRRWPKFLRLSLYLLSNDLKYPEALGLGENEVKKLFKKYNLDIDVIDIIPKNLKSQKKLLISYEMIWKKVLKKKRLIN